MSALQFIRDTIYSLKRDYGLKIALGSEVSSIDLGSGIKTSSYDVKILTKAILLPTAVMTQFMQQLTNGRIGTVEKNTRVILIDKRDIGSFLLNRECFVAYSGNALDWRDISNVEWNNLAAWNQNNNTKFIRTDVKKIEDLLYAVTLTVQQTDGLTVI